MFCLVSFTQACSGAADMASCTVRMADISASNRRRHRRSAVADR
jgi:hypothetical protein